MPAHPVIEWPEPDELLSLAADCRTQREAAERLGVGASTLAMRLQALGIRESFAAALKRPIAEAIEDDFTASVHTYLTGRKRTERVDVEQIADALDAAPRRIRVSLDTLRGRGIRIPEEAETGSSVALQRVVPAKQNLHKALLGGKTLRFGVVSDTHLSSSEEARAELNMAYDRFAEEGIAEVWHAGDWTCGRGIFRTQDSEIHNHTYETQVDYLEANYPRREGIVTRGITGNHDIEGEFGKIGANPLIALSNRRDDIEFLGDYSAWIDVSPTKNPCWVHLLHGKGGGSYAFSYQAQKLADGYSAGRKPAVLIVGHFHRRGNIEARGIEIMWPACFEWRSPFMERLGLTPTVGFHIVELTVAKDGTLVQFLPRFYRFFEGRKAA